MGRLLFLEQPLWGQRQLIHDQSGGVLNGGGDWSGAGTAFSAWPELAGDLGLAACDPGLEPTARDLLGLAGALLQRGEGVEAWEAVPVYLREKVAWKTGG